MYRIVKITIVMIVACYMALQALAQPADPRSIGMGGANTAAANGVNTIYWNPANLASGSSFSMAFPQLGGYVSNNTVTGQDVQNIANEQNQTIRDNYFDNVINAVPAEGLKGAFTIGSLEGITIANVGISVGTEIYGNMSLSKDAVGMMLRGQTYLDRKMGQDLYSVGTADGTAVVAPTVTYAMNLFGVDAGLNLKFYSAGAYAKSDFNMAGTWTGAVPNPYIFTGSTATIYRSTSPSGFGVDIGAGYNLTEDIRLGFVIQNLGSDITWSGGTQDTTTISVTTDPATGMTSASQSTTTVNNVSRTVAQNTTYRLGIAYNADLLGPTLLTADYEIPTYTKGGFHAGVEKYMGPLALRMGVSPDVNNGNMMLSLGTGLQIYAFGINVAAVIGDGKSAGGALSMNLDF